MKVSKKVKLRWLLLSLLSIIITVSIVFYITQMNSSSAKEMAMNIATMLGIGDKFWYVSKACHILGWFIMPLIIFYVCFLVSVKLQKKCNIGISLLLTTNIPFIISVLTEYLQGFNGRSPLVFDILLDMIGTYVAVILLLVVLLIKRIRKNSRSKMNAV